MNNSDISKNYNIVLPDINRKDILGMLTSDTFSNDYLSVTQEEPKFPVKGELKGWTTGRNYINLICRYKNKPAINVMFFIEIGIIRKQKYYINSI